MKVRIERSRVFWWRWKLYSPGPVSKRRCLSWSTRRWRYAQQAFEQARWVWGASVTIVDEHGYEYFAGERDVEGI